MDTCHHPAGPRWAVGGRFVDTLARRDFDDLAGCLDPAVRFRGLVPSGPFEVVGPEEVVARFRRWFGGPDDFEVVDATLGEVGPKLYMRWRVAMASASADGPARVAEQHLFATIDGSVVSLDLLCSGFSKGYTAVSAARS
jgi:hypothetical protein